MSKSFAVFTVLLTNGKEVKGLKVACILYNECLQNFTKESDRSFHLHLLDEKHSCLNFRWITFI